VSVTAQLQNAESYDPQYMYAVTKVSNTDLSQSISNEQIFNTTITTK